jgi:hypothetical protein
MSVSRMLPCGCFESNDYGKLISYNRCKEHYVPERDDPKILEAARNERDLIAEHKDRIYVL